MMVAVAVFTMVMAAILILNGFGLRVGSGVGRQLEFSSKAHVVNLMVSEIKESEFAEIRNFNGTSFLAINPGQPQRGNAISLRVSSASGTQQVYYWVDSQGQLLRWQTNSARSKLWLNNITNAVPFAAVDFQGNVLSNLTARLLIDINLAVVDSSDVDFRQTMLVHAAAEKRN